MRLMDVGPLGGTAELLETEKTRKICEAHT